MDIESAYARLESASDTKFKQYFSSPHKLSLGTGLVYKGVRYPLYNAERDIFQTATGRVLVLTHECDVDQSNPRVLNDHLIICPLIPLDVFLSTYISELNGEKLTSFLDNMARRNVSRVFYLPTCEDLPYGSVLYLNQMTSTHISSFGRDGVEQLCALTAYGLSKLDSSLTNHLLRVKSERLYMGSIRA